ncbi:GNAT family N-acetyltransferase [Janthinobacterium sp. YR213]|uniref:GNAT family N-acetyltransferase n=1 Tax=Janthinobacterium sp. YR213 TaxID=1881027 RepID=UPI000B87F4A0|nr:GNAT family N-acetyltransferase [Janthinobacterium sp. YR213]
MMPVLDYRHGQAGEDALLAHFLACDAGFLAALRARTELGAYVSKLHARALRYEAWSGPRLAGLLAAYHHDASATVHISNVSVLGDFWRLGIAGRLLGLCLEQARRDGMRHASLEVAGDNHAALALYGAAGFLPAGPAEGTMLRMQLQLIHP